MPTIPDFSFFDSAEVQFTKDGAANDPADVAAVLDLIKKKDAAGKVPTDLFVMSHGWNNDMDDARKLYRDFFRQIHDVLKEGSFGELSARRFVVAGVLWPSKKFAEADLIPGNGPGAAVTGSAAGLSAGTTVHHPDDAFIQGKLDTLKAALDDPAAGAKIEEARELLPGLEKSVERQAKLANLLRSALPHASEEGVTAGDASTAFFKLDGFELIRRLQAPLAVKSPTMAGSAGGAASLNTGATQAGAKAVTAGSAAGLGDILGGITGAVTHLLNYSTYYVMKERAGTVGRSGVNDLLRQVRAALPGLKIHLIGHSFGGRLVTAATDGPAGQPAVHPDTLTLLQAAFSHNGFALHFDGVHDGFFRSVVTGKKVVGPVLITHSIKDSAVGTAYPIASRLSGVTAAALGDANDPFGGIGRNGAQKTPEAVNGDLLATGHAYQFTAGKLFNLRADDIIQEHSDICLPEVARALLAAVANV